MYKYYVRMKKRIYKVHCPVCEKNGRYKWLMNVGESAMGTFYPYCKVCRRNIKIEISADKSQFREVN